MLCLAPHRLPFHFLLVDSYYLFLSYYSLVSELNPHHLSHPLSQLLWFDYVLLWPPFLIASVVLLVYTNAAQVVCLVLIQTVVLPHLSMLKNLLHLNRIVGTFGFQLFLYPFLPGNLFLIVHPQLCF